MIDASWGDFWWEHITGPRGLVQAVSESLRDQMNVIIKVPSDIPWRHQMRFSVENSFRSKEHSQDILISTIDACDEWHRDLDPGRFLLERYSEPSVYKAYRERAGEGIHQYIIRQDILRNTVVWVKGLHVDLAAPWIRLIRNYQSRSLQKGLIVLEIQGNIDLHESQNTKVIDYASCVNNFDIQLFGSFILNQNSTLSSYWKRYYAILAAELCCTDAEVSEYLLSRAIVSKIDPLEIIQEISKQPDFCQRGSGENNHHVLSLYRNDQYQELYRRIWSAQVQAIYPLIEMERIHMIESITDELRDCLSEQEYMQFGHVLKDPMEVELGTLIYLMKLRKTNGQYLLSISDKNTRDHIFLLHHMRNLIAHSNHCPHELLVRLLSRID